MNQVRRRLLRQLILLGLVPAIPGCGSREPMRVAAHPWPGYEFMFLARDEGWLAGESMMLVETGTATESMELLRAGAVHGAAITLDELIHMRARGVALTAVLVFDVSAGADKVIGRPAIATPADLRGKRIGVELSAVGSLMLGQLLAAAGLDEDEVRVVRMQGNHRAYWDSGEVDAVVTFEPTAGQLIAEGGVSLFDSRSVPDTIFDVLAFRSEVLGSHAAGIAALIAAHFRGLAALQLNPADTAYRLARRLGSPGEAVLSSFRGLQLPGIAVNHELLAGTANRLIEVSEVLTALMRADGRLEGGAPLSLAGLCSDRFLPAP